jgi:anti-sigma-K factor RskA
VIALGAAGGTWAITSQQARDERIRADQLQADQARMNDVLAAPDARVRMVDVSGGGRVTAVVSPSRNEGVVAISNLPAPPDGKVYQLWLLHGNASPTSAGVMASGQREGMALIQGVNTASGLGVTVEPVGGSTAPTSGTIVTAPFG